MKQNPIASAARTKAILAEYQITPNKSLGQNFLISASIVERITQAADLQKQDKVIEIGPGLGALSEVLAAKAAALCLVELDGRLYHHLQQLFAGQPQVEIHNADARSFSYAEHAAQQGWSGYKIIANLPYHITSDLLKELLLFAGPWQSMTLMVQKEVAQKLVYAKGAENGPLALLLHYYSQAQLAFTVPPSAFLPQPEVHSAVIHLQRRKEQLFPLDDPEAFAVLLWQAFGHRRKTLVNSLADGRLGGAKPFWQQALQAAGISAEARAEQLSLHDFQALYCQPQVQEACLAEK